MFGIFAGHRLSYPPSWHTVRSTQAHTFALFAPASCFLLVVLLPLLPRRLRLKQSEIPGLVWGEAHKLVPVAFGVKKLVLSCVVEDDKVRGER